MLLVGPMPTTVGGDSVTFSNLVNDVGRSGRFDVSVADTSRDLTRRWILNPLTGLKVIVQLLTRSVRADLIVFHASYRGMTKLGPVAFLIARAYGKPVIIRLFGGSFDRYYLRRTSAYRWLLKRTILSADVCFFQTKHLVRVFTRLGARRVEWLANYTAKLEPPSLPVCRVCRRFAFLGQVRVEKGIDVILKSAALLPDGVTIDIFGPLYDFSKQELEENGAGRIRYGGILSQDEVATRLWDYDALILPTVHEGEGYPGVILEAFSHGLPAIATRWISIPELVDDTCGVLIEPRNSVALADAIALLHSDRDLYERLKAGARDRSQAFSTDIWTAKFVEICETVLKDSTGKRNTVCAAS